MSKNKRAGKASNAPLIAAGVGLAALLGVFGYTVYLNNKTDSTTMIDETKSAKGCTHSTVQLTMDRLKKVECVSQQHIPNGKKVKYRTDPPLSGDHYDSWVKAGFFTTVQVPEQLVHNLEHGNVVIYYDKSKLPEADLTAIRNLANKYPGDFDGVVAVPREDAKYPLILAAWEHALRLDKYDQAAVDKFVDALRGRGPEKAMR